MSFRVLVADSMADAGVAILADAPNVDLVDARGIAPDALLDAIQDCHALIVRSRTQVTAQVLAAGRQLKVVGRAGIGTDNIDKTAATERGIVVMNTPDGNAITTAEHTLSLMLSMARKIPHATASMKAGKWEKKLFMGRELTGKTLGLVGLGNIGRIVADRARGLHMNVAAFDPFFDADAAVKLGVTLMPLDELLATADVITVHTPLNDHTRGLISDTQIDMMKEGVMLINCARGGIYDENALLKGLESGKIAALALDVYVEEPPAKDHALVNHPRVICTPHLGASTKEAQIQVAVDVAQQVVEVANGEPSRNALNAPRFDGEHLRVLGPYIDLAAKMGSFLAQRCNDPIQKIEFALSGAIAEYSISHQDEPVCTSALVGILSTILEASVNAINARHFASKRGVSISETKEVNSRLPAYTSCIALTCITASASYTVIGSVFANSDGRFVKVDGISLEAVPSGVMLIIGNDNTPGMVGKIGSILGEAKINISRMHLGLDATSNRALSLISIENKISTETIAQMTAANLMQVEQVIL